MFNVLQWSYDNKLMVQFHPADIGPSVIVLVSDKDLNSAEGYIRPDEPGLLEIELGALKEEIDAKRYLKEEKRGSKGEDGDSAAGDGVL